MNQLIRKRRNIKRSHQLKHIKNRRKSQKLPIVLMILRSKFLNKNLRIRRKMNIRRKSTTSTKKSSMRRSMKRSTKKSMMRKRSRIRKKTKSMLLITWSLIKLNIKPLQKKKRKLRKKLRKRR